MSFGWLQETGRYADLAAILLFGLPHGALDVELARERFRKEAPRSWFFKFSVPYLGLSAIVLLAWLFAPLSALGLFLALSVYHFGREQTEHILGILVSGGAPIALAILLSPTQTLRIFAIVAGAPLATTPEILKLGALAWCALAALWTVQHLRKRNFRALGFGLGIILLYYIFTPLTALTLYFVVWHAPLHMRRLIDNPHLATRVTSFARAARLSLWPTALTLFLGMLLWPFYSGPPATRLLMLTIQGLAALTLPHMLFDFWLSQDRRKSVMPRQNQPQRLRHVGAMMNQSQD